MASKPRRWGTDARTGTAVILGLAAAGFVLPSAVAGPPFRTDDPVPADYQHGELYLFAAGTQAKGTN